jgi:hypothetical protein
MNATKVNPKKVRVIVTIIIVALFINCIMSSCTKEVDDEISAPIENIIIKMTVPQTNGGLKSATTVAEQIEIANGDTVPGIRDVSTLFRAIDENGHAINGIWLVQIVKTDHDDIPETMPMDSYQDYNGDQILQKFSEFGVYRISFRRYPNDDEAKFFFVFIGGIPGKVGDSYDNDFIFRIESKDVIALSVNTPGTIKNLVFIYFKYKVKPSPEKAYCFANIYDKSGFIGFNRVELKEWPFNKDYFYFALDPQCDSPGIYRVVQFVTSDDGGESGLVDWNNYRSRSTSGWDGIKISIQ